MKKMSGTEFDNLVEFFDAMAQTKWLSAVHNQLKDLSGCWNNKTILDVGCGTGRLLERGINEAEFLHGIDLSEAMIKKCHSLFSQYKSKANYQFQVGDAYHLPLENERTDIALSTCVMFLLPQPEKGIMEMLRVLKKGGKVVMLNPSPNMSPKSALQYANNHQINGFEREALLKWSNVSTIRHRYYNEELTAILEQLKTSKIVHTPVLEGLATITLAEK
ncbi:class I SAM-dependent methyltransferase [Halalkalibacter krulwichiae]|uniref:Phthiotriol/phenolphthiotriol dimycocerosates methyltransferase n=1 Tax=Halalkalibacter krulwichiae TaxID=199441 RepID=A0A1X9MEV1_9BACI|nr:class I SAM-dependent methyltransferase [Halalkalibacter krulwichiae]ARK31060.1 Phthiotriol/phenolphthiotriol dimycocerosates methyltransferase [Halalkalibacter krulwichiae]